MTMLSVVPQEFFDGVDRTWHRPTRGEVTATVDNNGRVYLTTASGQSRTVMPSGYRMTEPPSAHPQEHDQ